MAASASMGSTLLRAPMTRSASRRRRRGVLAAMVALALGGGLLGYLSHQEAAGEVRFGPLSYVSAT